MEIINDTNLYIDSFDEKALFISVPDNLRNFHSLRIDFSEKEYACLTATAAANGMSVCDWIDTMLDKNHELFISFGQLAAAFSFLEYLFSECPEHLKAIAEMKGSLQNPIPDLFGFSVDPSK